MTKLAASFAAAAVFGTGLAVLPATAVAQPSSTIAEVIVYGDDPCPRSTDDEVVVCARKPEADRYRLPENYRPSGPRQEREAWVNRARTLETVSDTGINSCSAVGPGGHTGCLEELIRENRRVRAEDVEAATPPPE